MTAVRAAYTVTKGTETIARFVLLSDAIEYADWVAARFQFIADVRVSDRHGVVHFASR